MTKVTIELNLNDGILLPLPIEIRRLDLALVGRGISTQQFDLNEGSYFVTSTLPEGQRLFGQAMVTGPKTTILLSMDSDFGQSGAYDVDRYQDDDVDSSVKIRQFRGNIISDELVYESRSFVTPLSFYVRGSPSTTIIQVLKRGIAPLNILIPAYPSDECEVLIHPAREGPLRFEVRFVDSSANLLFRYLTNGYLREAATLVQSRHFIIDHAPIEQASLLITLYTLLRIGELWELIRMIDDSGHWSHSSLRSPDSSVIRGEVLARLGRHHEAFEAFMELGARGVPVFTDGFYYATQRLNIYHRLLETSSLKKGINAGTILSKLRTISTHQAANYSVLAYTGLNIAAPDAVPYSEEISESVAEVGQSRKVDSSTEQDQEISSQLNYIPQDFSQQAINRGQQHINYELTVVNRKIVEALKSLTDAIANLPRSTDIDLAEVDRAISEASEASKGITPTSADDEITDEVDRGDIGSFRS